MRYIKLWILGLLIAGAVPLTGQEIDTSKLKDSYHEVNFFVEDNEACFRCHGELKYILDNPDLGMSATKRMAPCKIIDRDLYYESVHKSFSCTDCHSGDFMTFPHSMDSRFEEHFACLDCHGYDETYAQYHFETIEGEFTNSIHNMEEFSCWSCHDPHSNKAFMRNADDLKEAILYDNNVCLKCHADFTQFAMLSDREEIIVVESHDWLPNQAAHFAKVRCIECHTEINDSILIAHQIMPASSAVMNCTECHSSDSRLMHTLYKFQSQENSKGGFINGRIIRDSYVIGANQNIWLNWLSFATLGMMLLVIALHVYLRVRKTKVN